MAKSSRRTYKKVMGREFPHPLMKHQADAVSRFQGREYWANFSECGTGKTLIAIADAALTWDEGKLDGVLVLAPNGVHTNWTLAPFGELWKHMPSWCRWRCAAWSASLTKEEKRELDAVVQYDEGTLRILAMNWEAIGTERGFECAKQFLLHSKSAMIIADESDAIKNPKAVRTKKLMKLRDLANYRRIITGTPINNAPFDAFSQFSFLSPSILRTTSFYAFKAEYAEMLPDSNALVQSIKAKMRKQYGSPQIVARGVGGRPKYKNLDRLAKLMEPHVFRALKKDCLDLPDKVYKSAFFDLTPKQRAIYKKAKDDCRLEYENADTPFSRLVAIGKLAQITSGYYLHPEAADPVRIDGPNPKLDILVERVRAAVDAGEKVIVWARFHVEIEDIVAALKKDGLNVVSYYGPIKKKDRNAAIDQFERGDAEVFVGNQQTGGVGITLVAASYIIYFSNDFSMRNRVQSEDRAHRKGQTRVVTYLNIAARRTVDEIAIRAVESKMDVAATILDRAAAGDLF